MNHVTINNSYSTCSVTGKSAGGFVGIGFGKMTGCYATGLVLGTGTDLLGSESYSKDGAFAYSLTYNSTETPTNCKFFEMINERPDTVNGGYKYLTALGQGAGNVIIPPLDGTASDYNDFVGSPDGWTSVVKTVQRTEETEGEQGGATQNGASQTEPPIKLFHDEALGGYYNNHYPLKTVGQLGASVAATDLVATHYGDWPAPEIFVLNTPQGGQQQ